MRSPAEIAFRLRQEAANFALWLSPPRPRLLPPPSPLPPLPDPAAVAAAVRGSGYAAQILELADGFRAGRYPLLGYDAIQPGRPPEWRRDSRNGVASSLGYFRRLPYLDPARVGDQKLVWELNRHAHLVTLAQAWQLSGEPAYLAEIETQLLDWRRHNPFQQGINWTAALEVAFRAMAWLWVYHLAGGALGQQARASLLEGLYQHGRHLEFNLSTYASPNTHLLGEAVALHALGRLFPDFPGAAAWRAAGSRIVSGHLVTHVLSDGLYFEQSTYYHVYALDMFLFHALLEPVTDAYRRKLHAMAEITAALAGPARRLPFFGDDDGGRWFHPYGDRAEFCRATLAATGRYLGCSFLATDPVDHHTIGDWWLGAAATPPASPPPPPQAPAPPVGARVWAASGLVTLPAGTAQLVFDAGSLGQGTAGHSHADALSLVLSDGPAQLLHDPGTYCYLSDPASREYFRSTAAHNTVRVNQTDQAVPAGLFRWRNPPQVELLTHQFHPDQDWLEACCTTPTYRHWRQLLLLKTEQLLFVWDQVEAAGEFSLEQFWHTPYAPPAVDTTPAGRLALSPRAVLWSNADPAHIDYLSTPYAPAYGRRHSGRSLRVRWTGVGSACLGTVIDWRGGRGPGRSMPGHSPPETLCWGDIVVCFRRGTPPEWDVAGRKGSPVQ